MVDQQLYGTERKRNKNYYCLSNIYIVSKKAKIRNLYNQVPYLTQYITWDSDKNTRKHHIQDSQEVSPFPAGDHKAAMNRHSHKQIAKPSTAK